MDFPLTDEQRAFQARVRALADQEFRERAARWDEREEYPWDNVKRLLARPPARADGAGRADVHHRGRHRADAPQRGRGRLPGAARRAGALTLMNHGGARVLSSEPAPSARICGPTSARRTDPQR